MIQSLFTSRFSRASLFARMVRLLHLLLQINEFVKFSDNINMK